MLDYACAFHVVQRVLPFTSNLYVDEGVDVLIPTVPPSLTIKADEPLSWKLAISATPCWLTDKAIVLPVLVISIPETVLTSIPPAVEVSVIELVAFELVWRVTLPLTFTLHFLN